MFVTKWDKAKLGSGAKTSHHSKQDTLMWKLHYNPHKTSLTCLTKAEMGREPKLLAERGEERRRERRGWERGGLRIKGLTVSTVLTEIAADPFTLTCATMQAIFTDSSSYFFFWEEKIKTSMNENCISMLHASCVFYVSIGYFHSHTSSLSIHVIITPTVLGFCSNLEFDLLTCTPHGFGEKSQQLSFPSSLLS